MDAKPPPLKRKTLTPLDKFLCTPLDMDSNLKKYIMEEVYGKRKESIYGKESLIIYRDIEGINIHMSYNSYVLYI